MAWPQAGGVAYSAPGVHGQYPTVRAAIHGAREAAQRGDTATVTALRAAITRGWHQPVRRAAA